MSETDHSPAGPNDCAGETSKCDQCWTVARCACLGEENHYEASRANLCAECLRAALALLEGP